MSKRSHFKPGRIPITLTTVYGTETNQVEIDAVHVDPCGLAIHQVVKREEGLLMYGAHYVLTHVPSGQAMFAHQDVEVLWAALHDLKVITPDWNRENPPNFLTEDQRMRFNTLAKLYNVGWIYGHEVWI